MAKGRKHGSSERPDRLLGTNGYGPETGNPDYAEDDVWSSSPAADYGSGHFWAGCNQNQTNPNRSSQAERWTRNGHRHVGGLSLVFEDPSGYGSGPTMIHQYCNMDSPGTRHAAASAASAPVDVPVWPRMVRADPGDPINGGSVELDRDESEWVPPHVYLAREHGKSVATSVFEGVGRTLKGRDMSRVRDAVWSKTGFFG